MELSLESVFNNLDKECQAYNLSMSSKEPSLNTFTCNRYSTINSCDVEMQIEIF